MRRVKQRMAEGRLRRRLVVSAVAVVALVAAGVAVAATKWPTAKQEIATSGINSVKFCGTKPINLAVEDGFGTNAWSAESYAAVKSTAAQCKNVKVIMTTAGDFVTSQEIANINAAVAQGANALTIIADTGADLLPAIQAATKAGVKVVVWGATAGGTAGKDYVNYVDWNDGAAGTLWANWIIKALHGHGNVVYTGGPPGNPVGADQLKAIVNVFANHPGMHLLTGDTSWPATYWDPATAATVTAAFLAQYPKIDGIISNFGTDALATAQTMEKAGRKLVPIATLDANGLSCLYKSKKVPLMSISSRNWLGRIAARKAIAAAEGLANDEPAIINLPAFEDTLAGKTYQCNPKAAPDFYPSNKLTPAQITKFGTTG